MCNCIKLRLLLYVYMRKDMNGVGMMNREQALARIEDLLSRANKDNPIAEGAAFGFIDACLLMGILGHEEAYDLQARAFGLKSE